MIAYGNNNGGKCVIESVRESTPVFADTVKSSGAPGFRSSPPIDAPRQRHAAIVIARNPAARISGTTTGPMHTATLVWLMTGTFTINPMTTTPGTSKNRTCRSGFTSNCTRCRSHSVWRSTYANPIAEQIGTTNFSLLNVSKNDRNTSGKLFARAARTHAAANSAMRTSTPRTTATTAIAMTTAASH